MLHPGINSTNKNLTRFPSGSLRELLAVSLPLMLALMSGSLMFFLDRLLLAHFSIDAHNASTSAGMIVTFLQFPFLCTACIAEVFVGQAFGAGNNKILAVPVWQMIWLSILSMFFFVPAGLWLGEAIFMYSPYPQLEIDYFKYLIYFSPIFCIGTALSSFYIGRGELRFVTTTVVLANVVNFGLAYALIFGFEPFVQPLGISGAAIATGIAQTFQVIVLFIDFLRRKNRETFGTGNCRFVWSEFLKCIRVGLPSSMAHSIEIFAWAVFFMMLTNVSKEHITVISVAQSIFFLFTFMTEGISKGATAIAANMIGAGKESSVWKLLSSGIRLYLVVFFALGLILVVNPEPLIHLFISPENSNAGTYSLIASSCVWVWLFFLFDGIHWLVVGLLTAAGDTKFVLKIGSTAIWLFALLPTYVFVVVLGCRADIAWAMTAIYGLVVCSIYLWRFQSESWKGISFA